jgi:hypothetical protein
MDGEPGTVDEEMNWLPVRGVRHRLLSQTSESAQYRRVIGNGESDVSEVEEGLDEASVWRSGSRWSMAIVQNVSMATSGRCAARPVGSAPRGTKISQHPDRSTAPATLVVAGRPTPGSEVSGAQYVVAGGLIGLALDAIAVSAVISIADNADFEFPCGSGCH